MAILALTLFITTMAGLTLTTFLYKPRRDSVQPRPQPLLYVVLEQSWGANKESSQPTIDTCVDNVTAQRYGGLVLG